MDTNLLAQVEQSYIRKDLPNVEVGDTVEITTILRDEKGEKRRTQPFKGFIIAMSGSGTRKTITVRKISHGVGVEKIMPLHSPNIEKIQILKKGKVRQANLYYMRDRVGKRAMKLNESDKEIIIPVDEVVEEEIATEDPAPDSDVETTTEANGQEASEQDTVEVAEQAEAPIKTETDKE